MKWILAVLLLAACPAWGQSLCGSLWATVDGVGSVSIDVEVYRSQHEDLPPDWVEIVIARKIHGTCHKLVAISPGAVWDIPEPGEDLIVTWSEPIPVPNRHYHYEVMARDAEGGLYNISCCCNPSYDIVTWGEAICMRGRLVYQSGYFDIQPCEDGCWSGFCGSLTAEAFGESDHQALFWSISGQVLNFYGVETYGGMPTNCHFWIDRVEPHDGDCGPVPNQARSWGDLKAMYR